MEGDLKEVFFDKYCKNCKHSDTIEQDDPCFECLANPGNVDSHKPVKFEEK